MLKGVCIGYNHFKEDSVRFTKRRIHWLEYSPLHMGLGESHGLFNYIIIYVHTYTYAYVMHGTCHVLQCYACIIMWAKRADSYIHSMFQL